MTTPEGLTEAEYQEIVADAAASAADASRESLIGIGGLALVLVVTVVALRVKRQVG
ncbi:hypothetical protein [Leptothoe kymatousa]|uniref:Uncharacterized protein n=1 Tax=Leptothoe kymatousa TAU-MAC 1615 TaxID=2364775 RepID=A0ABS5Y2W3_9CYAN|nr:hypothetical protein [Leptothoe kymatousa]MBT9312157.1 hypothetical protein [Leptothoe kymatousa TAU-MAC 1615]